MLNVGVLCVNCVLNVGVLGVNVVLNVVMGNHFFEKMAGIFGGRNESDLFSAKGEASPIGRVEGWKAGQEAEAGIRHQASGIRHQVSGIRYQVSGIRHQASGIRYQASGIRLSIHLFSIGNYFHRTILPESNINPKIII